jgi:threonine dehydrogenase-like Zn-dependent dehydrogenase
MKALVSDGQLQLQDRPKPEFTGQETLIRLIKAGICNTDLEITRGYFGFQGVLGHEFVGVVEASRTSSLVGRRVVGEINAACGECEYCQKGLGRHCPQRTVLGIVGRDGAFQEYFLLPEENLHLVPESVPDEAAVFVEPLAAACEILDQVSIQPHEKVAVLGDGKLGLLIAMVLSQTGCSLVLVGRHLAKMKLVDDYGVELRLEDCNEKRTRSFDYVVEATGSPSGWEQALRLVKPRGTIILKSTFHGQIAVNPALIVVDEITMVGSRCGRLEVAMELLKEKRVHPTRLLQFQFPLEKGLEAFEMAQQPGVLKVILDAKLPPE